MSSAIQFIFQKIGELFIKMDSVSVLPGVTLKWIILGFFIIDILTTFVFGVMGASFGSVGRSIRTRHHSTRVPQNVYMQNHYHYEGRKNYD